MTIGEFSVVVGDEAGRLILALANLIVADHWPGLISVLFLAAAAFVGGLIWYQSRAYAVAYSRARSSIVTSRKSLQNLDLTDIEARLNAEKSGAARKLANAFKEFRETLVVVGRGDSTEIRNSIRPSAFLNADELGFSLKAYRFFPGVFVSFGLFLTFLGLVAVLSSTADILPDGQSADQSATMNALRVLLAKASAKFTISLTGLLCSIALNIWLRSRVHRIEKEADALAVELERHIDFISLEGLAEQQLRAVKDQTADMKALITEMTVKLSEPLNKVSESSMENIGVLVKELGKDLTSGLGKSLESVSGRIDAAATALGSVGASLEQAAQHFDTSLKESTSSLDASVRRLEEVSQQLTVAGQTVSEATPAVLESIKETNAHSLKVAEGAATMVNAAKSTIAEERETVTQAMNTIQELIRSFESRAAAYDGQLEKAFQTYQAEVAKTIDRLELHGDGVQERFAEALGILQTVIENAKPFEPESGTQASGLNASSEATE
ncbi:methyl-accepting chemotaxis protein [Hwanghaeella grinnelliae]|uniref:Methyl-accepting chemotaxis protein n=1 Tax=Hwanghaeella grinnelliae TaxID=2500179 RepID=A0A3S2VMN1_9PROT|nr:methyl-accepting chemotaxis protein [Hwanghaeella grinnelliae]RVU33941.1 methyl-accepting chemotaxis protein [Hwanghaeella grinnelliae]